MTAPRRPPHTWRRLTRGALMGLCLWTASPLVACPVLSARYLDPTAEYPHGVLGDQLEWKTLNIALDPLDITNGARAAHSTQGEKPSNGLRISAGPDSVFEDIAPRLWDITGDGCPEIVTIQSHQRQGARLAIYRLNGTKIDLLATPHIGTRFRWLAPIGAADLDGDGYIEIAYIDRPHLAKTLRIWRFDRDREKLVQVGTQRGLTNHRIGEDFITGGLRSCADRHDLIVVTGNWADVMAVSFASGKIQARKIGPFAGQISVETALSCSR